MKKVICIHAHFYQPPRENPWLEYVEVQSSAYPFHDWNERITSECYLPNSASRVVNNENKIVDIINNYSKIDFNFGPTLLHWMRKFHKDAYDAIVKSDEKSVREKSPAAIAQCYNHMIMPLANERDKITQIKWGIKDFEYHFKRKPLGMWLPETAVDIATLEALAKEKIKFTILAEHQVKEIRKLTNDKFESPNGQLSLHSPYLCKLPSGKSILIFIFNGDISYRISFSNLLANGIDFAKALLSKFESKSDFQIVSIATDGETFGHHKRFGDMALGACLKYLEEQKYEIGSYSKYFEECNILYEMKLNENTSWSCAHGIGRWKEDCSCNAGAFPGGNQKWRKYLREGLDVVRDTLNIKYEDTIKLFQIDPWELRDDYIDVVLDRTNKNVDSFLQKHLKRKPTPQEQTTILTALEIQRHLMLMYTSCGWFFDDISGIETVQILRYAKRALQLSKDEVLEKKFVDILEHAKSNDHTLKNGKIVWEKYVIPSMLTLENIISHYVIALLFADLEKISHLSCYEFSTLEINKETIGSNLLIKGRIKIKSLLTYETKELNFISMFLYPFSVYSYVENLNKEDEFNQFYKTIQTFFYNNKFLELNQYFLENKKYKNIYSFWDMFTDEKNKILQILVKNIFKSYKDLMKKELENKMQMFCEIKSQNILLPDMLNRSLDLYFYFELYELIQSDSFELSKCNILISRAKQWNINFQTEHLIVEAEKKLKELFNVWEKSPLNIHSMEKIINFLTIFVRQLNMNINLWHSQNTFFSIKKAHKSTMDKIDKESPIPHKWNELFLHIADLLNFRID